jgi:uncharacterized protein
VNIDERDGKVFLRVRVQPKAARDAVCIEADGRVRVALTAPPVDGAANKALCTYIARRLALPKRMVSVAGGAKSRDKLLAIEGAPADVVWARLEEREGS